MMEEEFIRSASGDETVTDDKEATIRNLIAEVARLRGILQLCESASLQRAEGLQAEIERLRAALKECADDLAAFIEHQYAKTLDYPSQKRHYDRDMTPVIEARRLLEQKERP